MLSLASLHCHLSSCTKKAEPLRSNCDLPRLTTRYRAAQAYELKAPSDRPARVANSRCAAGAMDEAHNVYKNAYSDCVDEPDPTQVDDHIEIGSDQVGD
jgi:hypothetical protein